jgi:hypothetical protein
VGARQKLLVGAVFLVIALLYGGALAAGAGSGQPDTGVDGHSGFIGWLGGDAGQPASAARSDLRADCLAGQTLTVKGTCVLVVAGSEQRLRQVHLHAEDAVTVTARAPQQDTLVSDNAKPGDDVAVTVDGKGGDIALDCDDPSGVCVLTLD